MSKQAAQQDQPVTEAPEQRGMFAAARNARLLSLTLQRNELAARVREIRLARARRGWMVVS